jgi:hypothetical protein
MAKIVTTILTDLGIPIFIGFLGKGVESIGAYWDDVWGITGV